MTRFVVQPFYRLRELVNLLNEYEKRKRTGDRKIWSRKSVRTLLKSLGIVPDNAGERCATVVSLEQVYKMRGSFELADEAA